jgi:hypothetical protein
VASAPIKLLSWYATSAPRKSTPSTGSSLDQQRPDVCQENARSRSSSESYTRAGPAWEREHFDFTSWRFFKEDEFASQINQKDFFIAYILARDIGYNRDIFIFPVRDFVRVIRCGIPSKGQRKVYISRLKGDSERWVLRTATRFSEIIRSSRRRTHMNA